VVHDARNQAERCHCSGHVTGLIANDDGNAAQDFKQNHWPSQNCRDPARGHKAGKTLNAASDLAHACDYKQQAHQHAANGWQICVYFIHLKSPFCVSLTRPTCGLVWVRYYSLWWARG
jgi:hypothetical protein